MKSARSRKRAHDARTDRIRLRRNFARAAARALDQLLDRFVEDAILRGLSLIIADFPVSQPLCKCLLCGDTGQIEHLGGEVAPCPRGCTPATSEAEEGTPA